MLYARYILTAMLVVLCALPIAKDSNQLVAVEVDYAATMSDDMSDKIAEVERIAKADNIINTALKYLGVRYSYGQSSPKGFDCSGFTKYVFNESEIKITRTSRSQYHEGERVTELKDLRPGDLVFFGGEHTPRSVGHVGIVVAVDEASGKFTFVHASRSGIKVDKSTERYYSSRYLGARRIIL